MKSYSGGTCAAKGPLNIIQVIPLGQCFSLGGSGAFSIYSYSSGTQAVTASMYSNAACTQNPTPVGGSIITGTCVASSGGGASDYFVVVPTTTSGVGLPDIPSLPAWPALPSSRAELTQCAVFDKAPLTSGDDYGCSAPDGSSRASLKLSATVAVFNPFGYAISITQRGYAADGLTAQALPAGELVTGQNQVLGAGDMWVVLAAVPCITPSNPTGACNFKVTATSVATTSSFKYATWVRVDSPSSLTAAAAVGAIIGAVIGVLVCCCGGAGVLHVMGCIVVPCFKCGRTASSKQFASPAPQPMQPYAYNPGAAAGGAYAASQPQQAAVAVGGGYGYGQQPMQVHQQPLQQPVERQQQANSLTAKWDPNATRR